MWKCLDMPKMSVVNHSGILIEHFSVINYSVNTEIIFLHNYQFILKDSNNPKSLFSLYDPKLVSFRNLFSFLVANNFSIHETLISIPIAWLSFFKTQNIYVILIY